MNMHQWDLVCGSFRNAFSYFYIHVLSFKACLRLFTDLLITLVVLEKI